VIFRISIPIIVLLPFTPRNSVHRGTVLTLLSEPAAVREENCLNRLRLIISGKANSVGLDQEIKVDDLEVWGTVGIVYLKNLTT
jgi:hypothetical protein